MRERPYRRMQRILFGITDNAEEELSNMGDPIYTNGALSIYHKPNAVSEFLMAFKVGDVEKDMFITEEQFNAMIIAWHAYNQQPKVVMCGDGMDGPVVIGAKEVPDITENGATRLMAALAAEDIRDSFKGKCNSEVAERSLQLLLDIIADAIPRDKI